MLSLHKLIMSGPKKNIKGMSGKMRNNFTYFFSSDNRINDLK